MIAMKYYFFLFLSFFTVYFVPVCSQKEPINSNHFSENPSFFKNLEKGDPFLQEAKTTDSFQAKFLNMLLVLGLLVGFMVLASWSLKRMMKSRVTLLNNKSFIQILETRSLSPRSTLYLIELENKQLLLAETASAVTCLQVYDVNSFQNN
jgi:flagellar biogenesis protein FliO